MKEDTNTMETLWNKLLAIQTIEERRALILKDVRSKKQRYAKLASSDALRFLEILGGSINDAERYHWANEYDYEESLLESGEEYDEEEDDNWNLEAESRKNAERTAHWYVTGLIKLECLGGEVLAFEADYCEGYFNRVIGTPYDTPPEGNDHGIPL